MVEVRTKFTLPFGKVIKILISDKYPKNQISTSWIKKILQDAVDQICCGYDDEGFVLQFRRGNFKDSPDCKITSILQFFICGVCYLLPTKPQQCTPKVQLVLRDTT